MSVWDLLGLVGVGMILAAYALHVMRRLSSRAIAYSALNAAGAALILVSLWFAFNLSAAVMEGIWLCVSVYGLFRARPMHRRARRPHPGLPPQAGEGEVPPIPGSRATRRPTPR